MQFHTDLSHTQIADRTVKLKFLFINVQIQLRLCSLGNFFC